MTENDTCGLDAVQYLTGCTLGKGNLICRDRGKQAFSFFVRSQNKKLRVVVSLKFDRDKMDRETLKKTNPHHAGRAAFTFSDPTYDLPARARIFEIRDLLGAQRPPARGQTALHGLRPRLFQRVVR